MENAPWGVVASVTLSTNPAATVINNAISLIAAGNIVIFAPHPAAKKVSQRAITLLNQAIVAAGGPENFTGYCGKSGISKPRKRLSKYSGIGLLVVTGGEAVVEAARKHTNKRLIAAGAGNPPVVVDETADLPRAAQSIVKGASLSITTSFVPTKRYSIVVDSVADELMRLMEGQHAVKLTAEQWRSSCNRCC
ncbi:aldehyde dehydrogenase family protein [Escherichia coli]|nr:aldehyde dehydrogenase family protein [Escherichia coli]